ncbi:MAG: acetyltransferase [uncultured bacterium]|nr:MAG: acetyltransferase [uncultured bacterium]OGT32534.1 MAG: hypothetical protein A3C44_02170 [Gammaproteobacteria bacterium RIFCSPHIGHO2_02_FULL_39_13]OGT48342.1 MAG: hypothetical protein A3E53_05865 [Gammaproteobacteria bacterium RIFCSPHIGHO2_12_FULL_39_24]
MIADCDSRFSIEKLQSSHIRKSFTCGITSLDTYLQKQATQDERRHVAVTYILHDAECNVVAGFYTLSSMTIESRCLSQAITKKLPNYPLIPATLIGRLAIDKEYQGKKLGEILLMDALHRFCESSKAIASFAVVVEAINKEAVRFYEKYGFIHLIAHEKLLYMAIKAIEQMLCLV